MANEIRTYSIEQLQSVMADLGQPKFRAKQIHEWLHSKHASSYDVMTNLPLALRQTLLEQYPLSVVSIVNRQISCDGTRKYVLSFNDGNQVETVGIPSQKSENSTDKLTVCFSTQIGCAMACSFCATGKEGFTRNLVSTEMIDQIVTVQNDFGQRVSNVVAMGQGEPFLNYDEVIQALRMINSKDNLNIGARHITLSTCGLIEGIKRFANEPEQYTLAISLHSAIQEKRDVLMPRVSNQPLDDLKKALSFYINKTGRRVTLEYLLAKDVNDGREDLNALTLFCKSLLVHVNILPVNEVKGSPLKPSTHKTTLRWINHLNSKGIEATLRKSRGSDISGACGQLKNSLK